MSSLNCISKKVAEAPKIDFGDLFNESVLVFKKVWLQGFILQLLSIGLSLPLMFLNFSMFQDSRIDSNSQYNIQSILFDDAMTQQHGSVLVIYYLVTIVVGIISSLISFGFFRIIAKMDMGQGFLFSDFFYFFRDGKFTKSLLLVLANFGVAILAVLMCVFPIFYVMIPLMFVTPFYVFNSELSILDVLKSSFALGHKKWGITFAITFLNIISLYVLIMLTCGLGALFFSCFLQMPIYVLYKKIISFESLENQL